MKNVYKWAQLADLDEPVQITMSPLQIVHAEILPLSSTGKQEVTVWAEHRADHVDVVRSFQIYGTGHDIPTGATHLLTVRDGFFVWHLYEFPQGWNHAQVAEWKEENHGH